MPGAEPAGIFIVPSVFIVTPVKLSSSDMVILSFMLASLASNPLASSVPFPLSAKTEVVVPPVSGLIGVPLMFASGLLVMFESMSSISGELNLLVVPLAVQEMVFAVWLIVKGFRVK